MRKLRLSNAAREFILRETAYLKQYGASPAARFRADIEKSLRNLARYPELGPLEQSHPIPGVRRIVAGHYVIHYAVGDQTIDVLLVRHGRQSDPWLELDDDEDFES